jgi:hypothetical protein
MDRIDVESCNGMLGDKPRVQKLLCQKNGYKIAGYGAAELSQRL